MVQHEGRERVRRFAGGRGGRARAAGRRARRRKGIPALDARLRCRLRAHRRVRALAAAERLQKSALRQPHPLGAEGEGLSRRLRGDDDSGAAHASVAAPSESQVMTPAGPLAAGWQAIERDDLVEAERIARAALAGAPADGEALYLLGSSLLFQNRFGEALAPLGEAERLAPRRGARHRLGYCRLALGDFAGAEGVLRREVQAHPDLIDAWNALGVALVNQAKLE